MQYREAGLILQSLLPPKYDEILFSFDIALKTPVFDFQSGESILHLHTAFDSES
jgi:hypothetical protein